MKRRLICTLLAAACLLGGAQVLAAGGAADSLVSVLYLEQTFLPALEKSLQARAEQAARPTYDAALARLDELGGRYLAGMGGAQDWKFSDTAQVLTVKRGDVISLSAGSTVLWLAGIASAGAGLVDATAGAELSTGAAPIQTHRYLNALEESPTTVTVLSDAAQLSLQGCWAVTESSESTTDFTDLLETEWYYPSACYVVDMGIFTGVSDTLFLPDSELNRAMLATIVYRMEDEPTSDYTSVFSDVSRWFWAANSVEWAASVGIIRGDGRGHFNPLDPILRNDVVVMFYRYAKEFLGLDVSQRADLSVYPDARDIKSWAREEMSWAIATGIFPTSGGRLLPSQNATRAEVAVMLHHFDLWVSQQR